MAYNTSDLYKEKIFDPSAEHILKIIINDNLEVNEDYIDDFDINDESFEGDTFTLGSAITCGVKLSLDINALEDISLEEIKKVKVEYGLYLDDETIEYVPIGEFDVIKYDLKNEFIVNFQLEDYMNRFDKEFDASNIVPCTRGELVQVMCDFFEVELGSTEFINSDKIIAVYDNTIKAKTWLSFISERAGGYSKFRYDGKLYIRSYGETDICAIDEELIGNEESGEQFTISRLLYENATQHFFKGDETGVTVQLSNENPLSCTQEEVDNIYESLKGLKFQTVDIEIFVDPAFETGDRLNYGNVYSFVKKKWSYAGGFNGGYKITLKDSKKMSSVKKVSDSQRIRKLQSTMNEVEGNVEILIQETNEQQETLTKYYQDLNEFIFSIKKTSNNNLLKNSVMFAYDTNNIPDSWEVSEAGVLSISSNTESITAGCISGHSFMLKNKKVKQRIYVKPNSNSDKEPTYYTFSTKIKKDITGTCYIKIYNSNEEYKIELQVGESSFYGTYGLTALLPKDTYYDIEFYGSDDSNVIFTDNMFSLGEYGSAWSQASGEIMNTQVNLNQNGVLVKSSIYVGDYTVMSPLEFAGYSNINGTITKVFSLNKDITLVKKLESEDEIKMAPIKIVPVTTGDLQGWAFVPSTGGGNNG